MKERRKIAKQMLKFAIEPRSQCLEAVMHTLSRRIVVAAIPTLVAFGAVDGLRAEIVSPVPGKRVALRGYDPVSYFTNGKPERGVSTFWVAFDDAVYLFASAKHRALFEADPERYAPQYHGYCTIKISEGERAEPDPEAWVVVDGKLYVFRSKRGLARFNDNASAILGKANAAWQSLRGQ
jgi:YHS domain-containing protein